LIRQYISWNEDGLANEAHYNMFESQLTGRNINDLSKKPDEKYRKLFNAKVLTDASMAHKVNQLLRKADPKDTFLIICGTGHMAYSFGVPERIWS
jgi:uncharacterized iron-regulated protein